MTTRKRSRRIDLRVAKAIEELDDRGASPSQIYRELGRHPELMAERPELRTIQRIVWERAGRDESGTWVLDANAGPDAAGVLAVLAAVVLITSGATSSVTNLEATWIKTLTSIVPDLGPWSTYRAARIYIGRHARNESTLDLEVWLGMAPWRSGRREDYERIIADGVVPRSPLDSSVVAQIFGDLDDGQSPRTTAEVEQRLAELVLDDPVVAMHVKNIRKILDRPEAPEELE